MKCFKTVLKWFVSCIRKIRGYCHCWWFFDDFLMILDRFLPNITFFWASWISSMLRNSSKKIQNFQFFLNIPKGTDELVQFPTTGLNLGGICVSSARDISKMHFERVEGVTYIDHVCIYCIYILTHDRCPPPSTLRRVTASGLCRNEGGHRSERILEAENFYSQIALKGLKIFSPAARSWFLG